MQVYSKSDIGLHRSQNQDYCLGGLFPDDTVWTVVCDGMGGANGGSTASKTAAENIAETLKNGYTSDMNDQQLRELMELAVRYANKAVYEMSIHVAGLDGMGTTVVCAIAKDQKIHIVHAGDSRAYLCRENTIRQVTKDHSVVQELVDAGSLTPEEARYYPARNVITRALGVDAYLNTDYNTEEFQEGCSLIICTDGLSNYIDGQELLDFTERYHGEELTEKLIDKAKDLGGSDNITVAVIYG